MPRQTPRVETSEVPQARRRSRFSGSERGAALLETAVTLPIVLMICVGIFEFGRAYQTWQVLTNAAREGARVAATDGTTDLEVETAVRSYLAAERLGQRRHRADRGQPEGRARIEHWLRGHDSVSVLFHLARPGCAVREAGNNHWRPVDDVGGRHHAERKLGDDAHAQPNLRRSRHRRARRRRPGVRHVQHDAAAGKSWSTNQKFQPVVVATADLSLGAEIKLEDLKVAQVPRGRRA